MIDVMTPDKLYNIFGFYEETRMIRVPQGSYGHTIRCPHEKPTLFSVKTDIPIYEMGIEIEEVPLRMYQEGERDSSDPYSSPNILGYAGQCPKCGKVYYRDYP